jgi:predicted nucleic acid-binding Zn ribbon protein
MINKNMGKRQINSFGNTRITHDTSVKLGDALIQLVEEYLEPRHERFEALTMLWHQILPSEIGRHSKIVDITASQLKVQVDSPSYMYELRLCSNDILAEIKRRCPQAQIKNIKLSIG